MYSDDESPNIFKDLKISVYSKAFNVGSYPVLVTDANTSNCQKERKDKKKKKDTVLKKCVGGSFDLNGSLPSAVYCETPKSKSHTIKMVKGPLLKQPLLSEEAKTSEETNKKHESGSDQFPKMLAESSFTTQKLLQFCDKQRCLTVEKVMMERIQNMQESNKLIHDNLEHKWQAEQEEVSARRLLLEQNIFDSIHEQEMKNRPKREAQLAEDNMKSAQRVLERIQRVKDAEIEARKKCEDLCFYRKCRDKILECQKEYNQEYKDIQALLSSCENKELVSIKELKNLFAKYENMLTKTKSADLTNEDVNNFVKLVDTAKELHKNLAKEIEAVNAEAKKVKDIEKEKLNKENLSENNKTETSGDPGLSDCFDTKSLQLYVKLKTYLENFENSCKTLAEDEGLKSFRFNCQKAVTIPVNAISPISCAHLLDKYKKLYELLSGKLVDVGGVKICASQHPQGVNYCKQLLAKKFVRQGDLTVSSKPDAAFSIAAVLASLWIDFPDFGQLTLAYFLNSCPYLAPVFLPQLEGQSVEEYHKSLGYHYSHNGEVEKQDSFLKRMSGIMRLYAAVLISKPRQPGKQNPLGISEGWRWISALLNLEPRPDICATLLHDFLVVAGNEMFRVYGAQFKKLLAYICQEYFPRLEKVTPPSSGGPISRLEGFLQKVMKNGSIPPPEALLPPNFW